MEAWPGALQQLLNVADFGITLGNTKVRSETDVGPAKTRSRFTDGVDIYSCSIDLDMDTYNTFLSFYKTDLNNGVTTFAFNDPITGDPGEFRFLDDPQVQPIGGRVFSVKMKWEKLP